MSGFPGLVFKEHEGKLLAGCQTAEQRPKLSMDSLRAELEQAGFGKLHLTPDAVTMFIGRWNNTTDTFEMPIGERRDGSFRIEVAPDNMNAWVVFFPAFGGKEIDFDGVLKGLTQAGVTFGVDAQAVENACQTGVSGRVLAATGLAPKDGQDTEFELIVDVTRDRAPVPGEDGLIDYRELGPIPAVAVGQQLMRRIPAVAAIPGRTVRNQLVNGRPGKDIPFAPKLAGVSPASDDPNLLLAAVGGQPVHVENGVLVEQIIHFKSVNMATGNIEFDGSVVVDGDVTQEMTVKASGDIVVNGTVEGSVLDAGGNIQVTGGVIAHSKLHAIGSVNVRFVENSQIRAGTVLAIDDMALQSDLEALNQISVGVKAQHKGRLVGGMARSMLLITAPYIGSDTGGTTKVQVGYNPVLEARLLELVEQIEKLNKEEENLKKIGALLIKQGKQDMAERAKASWKAVVQQLAQAMEDKDAVEKELALMDEASIEVSKGAEGAVDLQFGKKIWPLRQVYGPGAFRLVEEKLVYSAGSGRRR